MCDALVLAQGGAATTVIEQAPKDRAIAMPKEKWTQYLKDMDAKKLSTLRIVEGGKHNVNIRRITTVETAGVQPNTIEVWYVMEGSGTHHRRQDRKREDRRRRVASDQAG